MCRCWGRTGIQALAPTRPEPSLDTDVRRDHHQVAGASCRYITEDTASVGPSGSQVLEIHREVAGRRFLMPSTPNPVIPRYRRLLHVTDGAKLCAASVRELYRQFTSVGDERLAVVRGFSPAIRQA